MSETESSRSRRNMTAHSPEPGDMIDEQTPAEQSDRPRCAAEENFKAAFGHYPVRVELSEPTPDPQLDALVARWMRRGAPPTLRGIDGGRRS